MKRATHAGLLELWADDGTGLEICRSTMSYRRFLFLLNCLQLDDRNTRAMRLKVDKLAPSKSLSIGDRLKHFRGKCSFIQQATKIWIEDYQFSGCQDIIHLQLQDIIYMELHCDQQPEGRYKVSNDSAAIVQRLIEHLKNSNSNLFCDELYTSYLLAVSLLTDKITFLGAMGRHHREILLCFLPGKSRPVDSTRMGFRNETTLVFHVSQKGEAIIVLSTAHHDAKFNPWTEKPILIEHYAAKDAINIVDRTCAIYSVSKKTKRWPLTVFFVLLDVASVNAQILYNSSQNNFLKYRRGFLKTFALALLKPHLQERTKIKTLPINIQTNIFPQIVCEGDCLIIDEQEFSKKRFCEKDKKKNSTRKKDRCFMCSQRYNYNTKM